MKIVRITDHGDVASERITLRATADVNLYSYAIYDNTYNVVTEELSNKRRNFFWFPSINIESGDYIRLWTKPGTYKSSQVKDRNYRYHNFYWGLHTGVWNNDGDTAVLLEIGEMELHPVDKVK